MMYNILLMTILMLACIDGNCIVSKVYSIEKIEYTLFEDNSVFYSEYKKLFKSTVDQPSKIYVMRGPGSFTNLRFILTVARSPAILNRIPMKSCTLFEMVEKCPVFNKLTNLQIIVETGTKLILRYQNNSLKHMQLNEVDFFQPWTTYLNWNNNPKIVDAHDYISLTHFYTWPDLMQLLHSMYKICSTKTDYETDDIQPLYSMHPTYLKTETEI